MPRSPHGGMDIAAPAGTRVRLRMPFREATALLETTGRKSGEERIMPLIYAPDDDRFVIVASKGGAPEHPAWYLNLKAHPVCASALGAVEGKFVNNE